MDRSIYSDASLKHRYSFNASNCHAGQGKKKLIIKWKQKHNRPMIHVWQAVNFNFFNNTLPN